MPHFSHFYIKEDVIGQHVHFSFAYHSGGTLSERLPLGELLLILNNLEQTLFTTAEGTGHFAVSVFTVITVTKGLISS